MTKRRTRTPDERALAHRRRRATIADRYARERAERAGQLGLAFAPPEPAAREARDLAAEVFD